MADLSRGFFLNDSPIHRIDPRIRIVSAAVFTITAALLPGLGPALAACVVAALLLAASRPGPGAALARLGVLNVFVLFLWALVPITYPGTPLFSLGFFTVTRQGVAVTALLTLKANAVAMAVMALLATVEPWALGRALQGIRVPSTICHLLMFTYRYVHVIEQEYRRLMNAARLRGFKPGTNLHTYRTYAYLAGMLLVKSHERARRVGDAMACRGFDGTFRTLSSFTAVPRDFVFLGLVTAASLALVFWSLFSPSV